MRAVPESSHDEIPDFAGRVSGGVDCRSELR